MCNEVRRAIALGQISSAFAELRIPLRYPEGAPNMAPLDSIRITDPTVLLRPAGEAPGAVEMVTRRWSWRGAGGRPVYNFRSDGRAIGNASAGGRCLVPVDGFYEFTAPAEPKRKRKDKWLFTLHDAAWFALAAVWRRAPDGSEAFALLTCPPGPDVAPYHARQVVPVAVAGFARWLDPRTPVEEVCRPAPAGTLVVAPAG